ncbi:MAG: DUF222 domain-containing protein [Aeromicrobium sp.]
MTTIHEKLAAIGDLLDSVPLDSYSTMSSAEKIQATDLILRSEARVAAHKMAAARSIASSGVAREHGASSAGQLIANTLGGDRRAADRMLHQAEQVGQAPATEAALARGQVSAGQADVIASTLAGLPADVTPEQKQACEDTLIGDAPRLSLKDLRRRADRIADVFAPDQVDAIESETLAEREKRAWAKTEFWMVDRRDGTYQGGFTVPEFVADQLRTMLDAIAAPRNQHRDDDTDSEVLLDERPTTNQRYGNAFATLIEKVPTGVLPGAAGVGPRMTVNVDFDVLVGTVRAATLDTGTRLSPGEARRLACDLEILPVVLDGESTVLDVGRAKRHYDRHQRVALGHRDGGCTFPGCERPPDWCDAHHGREPWCRGGTTDIADGVLVCPFHHRLLHQGEWALRFADDGVPEYIPPRRIDSTGTPRRNQRYRVKQTA